MSHPKTDMIATAKAVIVAEAHAASDIDGHGDEGAGYDYAVFVKNLEAAGWSYQPKGLKGWVIGYDNPDGEWVTLSVSYDGAEDAQSRLELIQSDAEKYAAFSERTLAEPRNKDWAERAALTKAPLEVKPMTAFSTHIMPTPSVDRVAAVIDAQWPHGGDRDSIIRDVARVLVDKEIVRQYGPGSGPYRFLLATFVKVWAPTPEGGEVDFSSRPGRSEIVRAVAEAILAADHLYVDANIPPMSYGR